MSYRRALAEAFGTFVLVFGGVGTAVIAGDKIGNLGVAFAFGLSLLAMAYAIGPVSGCHINPAVSCRAVPRAADRRCRRLLRYWTAQVRGRDDRRRVLLIDRQGRAGGYNAGTDGLGRQRLRRALAGRLPLGRRVPRWRSSSPPCLVFTVLAATDRSPASPSPASRSASC